MLKFDFKKCVRRVVSSVAAVTVGALVATSASAQEVPPEVQEMVDTGKATVTAIGGIAILAFTVAITPFAGRMAMVSISQVFRSL